MSLINKFFSISKNLEDKLSSFKSLKKTKAILQLFSAIESYSENSEIRYVGGCVRKALNNEVLDDIDLPVNLKPNECIEALNKKLNGENAEEVDKWLTKEHQKLQEEFDFIAKTNVGTEFMSDEDIEKIKIIANERCVFIIFPFSISKPYVKDSDTYICRIAEKKEARKVSRSKLKSFATQPPTIIVAFTKCYNFLAYC